jgi:hypothetical protein
MHHRALMLRAADPDKCPVNMWDYLIPAAIGGTTGLLSGFGVRYLLRRDHPQTVDSAAHIVEGAVTLLVGGMTFILRLRHRVP